jgi:GNAT superfamily N-acetyltransferase
MYQRVQLAFLMILLIITSKTLAMQKDDAIASSINKKKIALTEKQKENLKFYVTLKSTDYEDASQETQATIWMYDKTKLPDDDESNFIDLRLYETLGIGIAKMTVYENTPKEKQERILMFLQQRVGDKKFEKIRENNMPDFIMLRKLRINEEYRNKGYGKELWKELILYLQDQFPHVKKLILFAVSIYDEIPQQKLYEFYTKCGAHQVTNSDNEATPYFYYDLDNRN